MMDRAVVDHDVPPVSTRAGTTDRERQRPALHVETDGHVLGDRAHPTRADVTRESVALGREAVTPHSHDPCGLPRRDLRRERVAADGEELGAVVERRAADAPRRHPATRRPSLVEHEDRRDRLATSGSRRGQPGETGSDDDDAHPVSLPRPRVRVASSARSR